MTSAIKIEEELDIVDEYEIGMDNGAKIQHVAEFNYHIGYMSSAIKTEEEEQPLEDNIGPEMELAAEVTGSGLDMEVLDRSIVTEWGVVSAVNRILRTAEKDARNVDLKVAYLLRAVSFIDLTTLGGDDAKSNVSRLSLKASRPILEDLLEAINMNDIELTTAAVCVYPTRVPDAVAALSCSGRTIPVAAVATGFPSGQYPLETRLTEIKFAVNKGATEIDVVIDRSLVITGKWQILFEELVAMKEACGDAHMKTILSVGELPTLTDVYKASLVAMYAGSDFIKTSTGKEAVNATLPVGVVMARAINDYYNKTGRKVGLKAAGGLRTAQDAFNWLILVREELGADWFNKSLFRIGASSLLADIEKELYILIMGVKPNINIFLPC